MQDFQIDSREWESFWARWKDTLNQIPDLKKEMLEKVGQRTQQAVRSHMDASNLHDTDGRVKAWQESFIGSGRGYIAVRPISKQIMSGHDRTEREYLYKGKKVPVTTGALTNFLASGHRVRGPSGRWKRYQFRGKQTRVKGFDFYKKAKAEAEKIAVQEAETMLQRLKEELNL